MEYNLDGFFSWVKGASKELKEYALGRYFDCLPDEELSSVVNLVTSAKKRRKRKLHTEQADLAENPRAIGSVCFPVAQKISKNEPNSEKENSEWWKKYQKDNILAMDVEKVEILNPKPGKPKYFQVAAEVVVFDANGYKVYDKKVRRASGSFRVNPHAKNGFLKRDCLAFGTPLETVKDELRKLFYGKLIVGLEIENDLCSLGFSTPFVHAEVFDLQKYWYREDYNAAGVLVTERLSLQSLCKHFFSIDMQPEIPHMYHSAAVDARWTMDLFTCVYMKLKNPTKSNNESSNEIIHFKRLYKL